MKSFITIVVAAAGLLDLTNASINLRHSHLQPRTKGVYSTMKLKGCFSSNGGAVLNSSSIYNTEGSCQHKCVDIDKPVMLLGAGEECWCGDLLPNLLTKVDDAKCNFPCPGDALNANLRCGGQKSLWNVWNDGVLPVDPDQAPVPSSTPSAQPGAPSRTAGNPPAATTIIETAPASSGSDKSKKSGPNAGAIAGGVVVGLVLIAAIAGGVFIYMRNQKRREIEEEHRRNAAVSSFTAGGKAPMSAGSSFSDTRLDPVVMARRESTGSIADNQDYSRRILKVTNA